ncbi:MAG: amino acid permease-associated region [Planctomycetaceae bacterium]|nr:amino acid permease-associated region [Planctomycetaceae bacterium]
MFKKLSELLFYISFGAGLAFGTSSFTIIAGLFEVVSAPWVLAAILASGLICVLISLSVAELASMYPSAPGIRTYLKIGLSDQISLVLTFLYLVFMVLVAGIEANMFALVLSAVFPAVSPVAAISGLIVFTVVVNCFAIEFPRVLQVVTTLAMILFVIGMGIYGVVSSPTDYVFTSLAAGCRHEEVFLLPIAMVMSIYLFTGFEWVTLLGFSPQSYERRIPVSMPLAIATNVVSYSALTVGLACVMSRVQIHETPIPQLPYLTALLGGSGAHVACGLSFLAVFSTFNAGIMSGSRLMYTLTREGKLPRWCAIMWYRTGTPIGAIFTLGILSLASSLFIYQFRLELPAAIVGSSIVTLVYAAFMLAALRLRKSQHSVRRRFASPVPVWAQWLVIVVLLLIGLSTLVSSPVNSGQVAIGLLAAFVIAIALARRSHTKSTAAIGDTQGDAS